MPARSQMMDTCPARKYACPPRESTLGLQGNAAKAVTNNAVWHVQAEHSSGRQSAVAVSKPKDGAGDLPHEQPRVTPAVPSLQPGTTYVGRMRVSMFVLCRTSGSSSFYSNVELCLCPSPASNSSADYSCDTGGHPRAGLWERWYSCLVGRT